MRLAWSSLLTCAVLAVGSGCSGLSEPSPTFGGSSYVVTATVKEQPGNGGQVGVSSHSFTIVIDDEAETAILGDVGGAAVVPFTRASPGELRFNGSIRFSSGAGSSGWSITYTELTVSAGANGRVTGAAHGAALGWSANTDVGTSATVTATLAGVLDNVPPTLTVAHSGAVDDPFSYLTVTASEPLPPDARPILVAADGSTTALAPPSTDNTSFVSVFYGPPTLLRYGQRYQLAVDGITDFAGLPASGGAAFTTRVAPPLVAEDGFESATGTMLGGAQILTGSDAPTITGARSLYIAPITTNGMPFVRPAVTRLALRVAVAPGDTVLRFAYRLVNPYGGLEVRFGSEGGTFRNAFLGTESAATTTTATIPGQGQVSLGPLTTAELPLPSDVGSELVLAEILSGSNGGLPPPPVSGVIIDDLRVE